MARGSKFKRQKLDEVVVVVVDMVVEEDRFSVLPDSVAHRILSFLTIEDIARISFTSKRCKKLCLSVPSLTIDEAKMISTTSYSSERVRFLDFLVYLIANHQSADLTCLVICWTASELLRAESSRVLSILNCAIQCRVNEVDLHLRIDNRRVFVMLLEFFHCESLTCLKLNINNSKLELPNPYGFSHLETLHLSFAQIVHADFGEWVSSFCKFLKKLYLEYLYGVSKLKISSSSLKLIDIKKCRFEEIDISSQSVESICLDCSRIKTQLNICAPNLLSLSLNFDFTTNRCSLGKMNLLQEASLLFSSGMDGTKSDSVGSLSSISQSQRLLINCECIQVLCDDQGLPFVFDNLETLELHHSIFTDAVIPSTTKFFQRLQPTVKTVYIKPVEDFRTEEDFSNGSFSGFGEEFWETQNISFLEGLEELKINLAGGKNEEALVEYFLKNAINLKKAVILCGSSLPIKIANKLISAALVRGAKFHAEEGKLVLEFKPHP